MLHRLGSLRYFLAVVEEGSVRKAAHACSISQPALTRHIQSLEEELGVSLFARTSRGMELTPFGEIVRHHATEVAFSSRDLRREIAEITDGTRGTLRISAGPGWSYSIVPEAISRLHKCAPGIAVECTAELASAAFPRLRAGQVDIVVNRLDSSSLLDDDLVHEDLLTIQHFIFAGAHHPLQKKPAADVCDLDAFPWISFRDSVEARQAIRELFNKAGLQPPEPKVLTNSYQSSLELLRSGDYLMVLPSTLAFMARQQAVQALPARLVLGSFPAGVIYRRSSLRLVSFARFKSILEDVAKAWKPETG